MYQWKAAFNFAENVLFSSFGVINFTDVKRLEFWYSTFYLYVKYTEIHTLLTLKMPYEIWQYLPFNVHV